MQMHHSNDDQSTLQQAIHGNQIKTLKGNLFLTVPVKTKNRYKQFINEVEVDNSTDYNLNFVDPLNSEGAKLIDEGISQGLSVEDAIKNANLKLFPDQNIQGPQAFSELKDIKNNEKKSTENKVKDQENQELNIIEADMDAQELNNIAENNYDKNISSENLDQVNEQEKLEEPNKDDEIG